MSFRVNLSPFAQGRSRESAEFANRAIGKLLPWIKQHYQIYTIDEPNFTVAGLYNYHLRGDYYLGLTKNNPALAGSGLHSPGPSRLVHFAELPRMYSNLIDESHNLIEPIGQIPPFTPGPEYGVLGGSAPPPTNQAPHFFTREVANGSLLTEFLFAEQATLTYRLLPYMDNFHQGVRNFLVNEAMHFIENFDRLRARTRNNFNTTHSIHDAFNLDPVRVASLAASLDAIPGLNTAMIGTIRNTGGPNVNAAVHADIATLTAAAPLTFVLPMYYVAHAHQEYVSLIRPGTDAATQTNLDAAFAQLGRSAVVACYQASQHFEQFSYPRAPPHTHFGTGTQEGFRAGAVRNILTNFFNTYFDTIDNPFPVGTIVDLNIGEISGLARGGNRVRDAFQAALNGQVQTRRGPVPPAGNRLTAAELDTFFDTHGTLFVITEINDPTRGNNPIRRYQMMSVDDTGAPSAEMLEVQNIHETYARNNEGRIPAFTLHRLGREGTNNVTAHSPMNIIGRLILSASYAIFNTGSYYTTPRDMRKLTAEDVPGSYTPINEALRGADAFAHGRRAHERGNRFGIIDLYAEQRADLVADYLAAMYDSLRGKYRDAFVNFFTGDFETNELSYYTNAVSNYISSQVAPEDAEREPVLVGPRLTTRLPQAPEQQFAPRPAGFIGPLPPLQPDYRQIVNYRNADPELVYYQIDSPLLRDVLTQLNTRFYQWYVTIAEDFDRGRRNLVRGGNLEEDDDATRGMMRPSQDPSQDRRFVRPSKTILDSMWPLLNTRATTSVESGEVAPHIMLRQLAAAVTTHRENTSQAIPAVPISVSFVDFGKLLRSPAQYDMPLNISSTDVSAFLDYVEATYYNDYGIIAALAANIETTRTQNYNQDQLIAAFKRLYNSYRNTTALNRFTFPATANLIQIFRQTISLPGPLRAAEAARAADAGTMTTVAPPAPVEQPAPAAPIPAPMRRVP